MTSTSFRKGLSPEKAAKLFDLREVCRNKRVIIIGDVHGCYWEVEKLLDLVRWDQKKDVVIFTGDLVDRGPEIVQIMDFVQHFENVYTVIGNHDEKFMRFLKGNKVSLGSIKETVRQYEARWAKSSEPEHERLKLLQWLESLPHIIRFQDDSYVVHAGLDPRYPVSCQNKNICMRIRTFNPDDPSRISDDSGKWWYQAWADYGHSEHVYFGHNVHDMHIPYNFYRATALDAGCVFGGWLRCAVVEGNATGFWEVPARKVHYSRARCIDEHEDQCNT